MKNLELILFALALSCSFLFSCKKDDSNTSQSDKTFVINATNQANWIYFSFSSGGTLKVANPVNSTDWDLAFKGTNLRTNSGKSGKGLGGAINANVQNESGYSSLTSVPVNAQFTIDDTMKVIVYMGYATDTVNSILYTWYSYDHLTHLIVPSNNVFIIKTASGKYVKLWIENYYRDSDLAMGYIKFKYFYQTDGSIKLN